MYHIEGVWVEIEQRGKGSYIKDNQMGRLKAEYDKAVAKIFGSAHLSTANSAPSVHPATNQGVAADPSANTNLPPQTPEKNNTPTVDADVASSYWVQSVRPSGKESQLLELVNIDGTVVSAYIKSSDKAIKTGSMLKDVAMVQKQSSYGQYNLINGYTIAA